MAINQSGELADTKGKEEPIGSRGAELRVPSRDGYKQSLWQLRAEHRWLQTGGPLAAGLLALAGPEETEA